MVAFRWLTCVAVLAARADVVLDDFSSGNPQHWDLSDSRVASAAVRAAGPEGRPYLALSSKPDVGWAAIALPCRPPLDLRGRYLSVWLQQDRPATVQFEFDCQPGPAGYPAYFLHEVPDFVGSWQRLYLRLDARAILHGEPRRDAVTRLRVSRAASGPQGTLGIADLRIVDSAPSQSLTLLAADIERFTPQGQEAGPLPMPGQPVLLGTTASGRQWTTSVPFIDLLNYEEKLTPEYIARMAANSVDVFHAGNVASFKPYWGPSRDHSFAESPLIAPQDVQRQIADLRQFVAAMHQAGIARVLSSSCSITIGGSPTKRLGFWAFYDHWDEYASFGLPPKPAHDPLTWNQKDATGGNRNPYGQPFTPWTDRNPDFDRYTPCPSNPEWQAYSRFVIRMIAECGFDGVFIDNNTIEGCCCAACRTAFRLWLSARYTPVQAQRWLGIPEPAQADLRAASTRGPLLRDEASDFWADQIRRFLTECQAAGEAVRPGFFLCPNWTGSSQEWSRDHVWTRIPNAWPMRELDVPLGEGEPDALGQQPGYFGTVPCYTWDARMHTAGGGRTVMLNYQARSANWVELAQAESAAFGEGAVHCAAAGGPEVQAVYARYRALYREHRDLFTPLESYAQVGVLCCRSGVPAAMSLCRMLLDAHIPFDFVDSRDLTQENLGHCPVLFCNGTTQVSTAELDVLAGYVRGGGRLVITGEFATMDERYEPRQRGPLFELIRERGQAPFVTREGLGFIAYTPLVLTPAAQPLLRRLLQRVGVEPLVSSGEHPGLRLSAYANRERIALHLVNFRVPKEGEPVPQTDVQLRVPLPESWCGHPVRATWHVPGDKTRDLGVRATVRGAEVVVPRLRVYGIVELRPG